VPRSVDGGVSAEPAEDDVGRRGLSHHRHRRVRAARWWFYQRAPVTDRTRISAQFSVEVRMALHLGWAPEPSLGVQGDKVQRVLLPRVLPVRKAGPPPSRKRNGGQESRTLRPTARLEPDTTYGLPTPWPGGRSPRRPSPCPAPIPIRAASENS